MLLENNRFIAMTSRLILSTLVFCGVTGACDDPFVADATRAYSMVATGGEHTCALAVSGEAYCWGSGLDGELGTGTKEIRSTPGTVAGGLKFKDITTGDNHSCALTTDGTAHCWGWNAFFQRGNSSDGRDSEPVRAQTEVKFSEINAGAHHTCALGTDSLAYCWGWNRYGQIGNATTNTTPTPHLVASGIKFVQVTSGGFHSCGITAAGSAYCWGANDFAQLGDGSSTLSRTVPIAVPGGVRFRQIDAGRTHTCGTALDNRFYCWGSSEYGELGGGSAFKPGLPGSTQPMPVSQQFPGGAAVYAGESHSCAIANDGTSRCWGRGQYGQLANGAIHDSYHPQPVMLFMEGIRFSSFGLGGSTHACGIIDQSVYCWGTGRRGQLGVAESTYAPIPQRVHD